MQSKENYENYENRLDSFVNWPPDSPDFIKDFVEAGFYYTGETDVVSCFKCELRVGNWQENDNPLAVHAAKSANCLFLLTERTKANNRNLPNLQKMGISNVHQNGECHPEAPLLSSTVTIAASGSVDKPAKTEDCAAVLDHAMPNDLPEFVSEVGFASSENRAISIKQGFPNITDAKLIKISNAGLLYNRTSQCFECYHCHTQFDVTDVMSCDDPITLHLEKFPSCKFIALAVEEQTPYQQRNSEPAVHQSSNCRNAEAPLSVRTCASQLNADVSQKKAEATTSSGIRNVDVNKKFAADQDSKPHTNQINTGLRLRIPDRNAERSLGSHIISPKRLELSPGAGTAGHMHAAAANLGSVSPNIKALHSSNSPLYVPGPGRLRHQGSQINPGSPMIMSGSPLPGPQGYILAHQDSVRSTTSEDETWIQEYPSGPVFHREIPMDSTKRSTDLNTMYGRLHTFLTWPQETSIQPLELSKAGFFYTGVEDGVKCYRCGIALKSWEAGDTAWGEHRKWSPRCSLVVEHNSKSTIQHSNPQRPGMERVAQRFHFNTESNPYFSTGCPSAPPFVPSPGLGIAGPPNFMGNDHFSVFGSNIIINAPGISAENQMEPNITISDPLYTNDEPSEVEETSEVEVLGPFTAEDFEKLLDAGFSVEMINKVQKLGHEKNGEYFQTLEETADAILYFEENGNLEEHCLPQKQQNANENNKSHDNSKVENQNDLRKELDKVRESQLCKICMDAQVGVAFHPCGHLFTCPNCAEGMTQCPVCRATIESSSRVYLS